MAPTEVKLQWPIQGDNNSDLCVGICDIACPQMPPQVQSCPNLLRPHVQTLCLNQTPGPRRVDNKETRGAATSRSLDNQNPKILWVETRILEICELFAAESRESAHDSPIRSHFRFAGPTNAGFGATPLARG